MALIQANYNYVPGNNVSVSDANLYMFPFEIKETVQLLTLNLAKSEENSAKTVSHYLGIYSLNGVSLSIANSLTVTTPLLDNLVWFSFTNTSIVQTLTVGNWWLGYLMSTSSNSNISLRGGFTVNPVNSFPGSFIGGRLSVTTSGLPASVATTDFDITGSDAMGTPIIVIIGA